MMLRPILATAVIVLLFAQGAWGGYWGVHNESLTPAGRGWFAGVWFAILWLDLALAMAHAALTYTYSPPDRRWVLWRKGMLGITCFLAVELFFPLLDVHVLRYIVGQLPGRFLFIAGNAAFIYLMLRYIQRQNLRRRLQLP